MLLRPALLSLLVCGLLLAPASQAADEAGIEFFEKRVRPILVSRCYDCHSGKLADGETEPKANLRLDSRAAALKGGDTGPAVVPGKLKESLLVDAINYGDLYQMPPKSKLPAEEIAALTKWVEMGAPWPNEATSATASDDKKFDLAQRKAEHWCWQPIQQVLPPAVKDEAWIKQPLDRFVLAKLEENAIRPTTAADKRTLIRRAYFDVIGLPPTPEQVEAFVRDQSPNAFDKVVDELLTSPHFGERWGRHWLDLVRYAETRGHEFDYNIPGAYHYRDYVIRALNADLPYDQFVIEHIAGDWPSVARRHPSEGFNEAILATGFWFFGEWIHSPVDIRKDETDRIDNMIDVFSKTFLGLTVSCARCHDHKFDAISQADYYALSGYLQSASYRLARFDTMLDEEPIARELTELHERHRQPIVDAMAACLSSKLDDFAKTLAKDAPRLQTELRPVLGLPPQGTRSIQFVPWNADGPTFRRVGLGCVLLGDTPERPISEMTAYYAVRRDPMWNGLAAAPGAENDAGKLGYFRAGRTLKSETFTLKSGRLHYLVAGAGHVYAAVDSHVMLNGPLHGQLVLTTGDSGQTPLRWVTQDLSAYAGHRVHLEFTHKGDEDFRVLFAVEAEQTPTEIYEPSNALVAKVAAADNEQRDKVAVDQLSEALIRMRSENTILGRNWVSEKAALINWMLDHPLAAEAGTAEQRQTLADAMRGYLDERQKLVARIRRESRLAPAMWEGTPVDENLLIRGNPKTVGPVVPRRMLEAMQGSRFGVQGSEGGGQRTNRLKLAQKLVSGENPFPARVMVNRIWHHLLGRGIVASTDNFGVLGERPSHPELLDYLANQFMQEGWSVKRMIRTIMLSSTYQQGSGTRSQGTGDRGQETAEEVDPQNLLFHRANVKRLEGEALRDAILTISGRLDRKQFGPSVPVHLTPFMQGRGRPAASGPLDGDGRRSIYIAVRRNFLPPMMLAFDTPAPFSTVGRRNVSNVPAQALILMNDPFVADQAGLWAQKVLAAPEQTTQQRIERMYLEAFCRPPTVEETIAARTFLDAQAQEFKDANLGDDHERAWADYAHILFNTKEFVLIP